MKKVWVGTAAERDVAVKKLGFRYRVANALVEDIRFSEKAGLTRAGLSYWTRRLGTATYLFAIGLLSIGLVVSSATPVPLLYVLDGVGFACIIYAGVVFALAFRSANHAGWFELSVYGPDG